MRVGMIGLGRMGSGMVRRLMRAGHSAAVDHRSPEAVAALVQEGAVGTTSLPDLTGALEAPRVVCLMLPVAHVDATIDRLIPLLRPGDTIIDGGNSHYHDDIAAARTVVAARRPLRRHGYKRRRLGTRARLLPDDWRRCRRGSASRSDVRRTRSWAQASAGRGRTNGRAAAGYLHCGPCGAGHFVKMVHNGIEYGLMAAYAEGLNILQARERRQASRRDDAETTPLRHPEHYQFDFDLAAITEVWRHGSVIASWLLDLAAAALTKDPPLEAFARTRVGFRRGPVDAAAANEEGVPAHVLAAALFERFASRGADDFSGKVLSAMRLRLWWSRGEAMTGHDDVRRARLLRHHGRPGVQEDLPGPPGVGSARQSSTCLSSASRDRRSTMRTH